MFVIKTKFSEKTAKQQEKLRCYTFIVPQKVNKITLKQKLSKIYGVEITSVNTMNYLGKKTAKYTKKGKTIRGKQSNYKKVLVTIQKGSTLDLNNSD